MIAHRLYSLTVLLLLFSAATVVAEAIEFHRDIRPLLSANCFACHGPDEEHREADLRLDIREGAFAEGSDGPIIVSGKSSESALINRILAEDEDLKMPPADSGHELTNEDVERIRKWIDQGADWQDHWAFVPIDSDVSMSPAPENKNPIDHFIGVRLQSEGLRFSPSADRRALIRRLSLDLIGLPPTPAESDAFVNDQNPGAYERVVDRLLASPHFGERMTVGWLDQARYADTNGYSIDGGRQMWLWRDWVINAYNENMPFDQFAIEQLAGDLLPDATTAQKIASGFNRNHMITHEGGTIDEENLVNYAVDRVKTTSEVFLGLTMGCAQCHDHKYDPITQRDFYRFFAFFNTLDDKGRDGDRGRNAAPKITTRSVLALDDADQLKTELENYEELLAKPLSSQSHWEAAARERLASTGRDFELHPGQLLDVTEPNSRSALTIRDESTIFVARPSGRSPSISARLSVDNVTALRLEFLTDDSFPDKRSGHGKNEPMKGGFVLSGFHASATKIPATQVDPYGQLEFRNVTASYSNPDYPADDVLDGRDLNGWSPYPENDKSQSITFELAEPLHASETPYVTVHLVWGGGGTERGDLMAGKYRLWAVTGRNDQSEIPVAIQTILTAATADRTASEQEALREYYNSRAPELANARYQIENLRDRLRVIEGEFDVMVMNTAQKPRKTFMLERGQYDQKGEEVTAGTPSFLPPAAAVAAASGKESTVPLDRLALARWIASSEHPLTSRVAVNRLWQMFFGTGLVATSADFGSQGEFPSHPELLDWLAHDFAKHDWDVKRSIRQMVTSEAYRQTSRSTVALTETDPGNRLLARGPRFRLQAEFVRDLALSTSGLLSPRIGGPSVRPYQPPGLWKEVSHYGSTPATAQLFVQDHGEKLYRRSMYTFWKRTAPPPSLTVFDAPNREVCTIRRSITNTPLQALVLLNDPQYVEASRQLAGRMLAAADQTPDRIADGFRRVLGRLPSDQEVAVLAARLAAEKSAFAADPELASRLLQVGEAPRDSDFDEIEQAAWTTIANLILNLSEAITKG